VSGRSHNLRDGLVGLAGVVAFVVLLAFTLAIYNQDFVAESPITIESSRAGLLMDPGAAVELNGVVVGRVHSVSTNGAGAKIVVHLNPSMMSKIPADVSAQVVPPTVFGAKYVALIAPVDAAPTPHIVSGAVISGAQVSVEINSTFNAVMTALESLPPDKLNAALTSVADAVSGHGAQLNELIRQLNTLLQQFNPSLPTLSAELPALTSVAGLYADVTPNLASTAVNAGAISSVLVAHQAQLSAFLLSLTRVGDTTSKALTSIAPILPTTLNALEPTVALLDRFSPELPCLFEGLVADDNLLTPIVGGKAFGGVDEGNVTLTVDSSSLPAYQYPKDLPVDDAESGPDCHDLPDVNKIVPYVNYDIGTHDYPSKSALVGPAQVPLSVLLFGTPATSAASKRAGRK
jgi:phospholipid/cholesterol/gamma-HCH transport system substrate-binding protein